MTDKTTKPAIVLYAHLDKDKDGGYSHLQFFATDLDGRHFNDSDTERLGWLRLDDFCIMDQMGGTISQETDYGWNYCYLRPYTVGYRDSEGMFKTLSKINKGLDKLSAKFGYATTYGQFVARVASIIGAVAIRFYEEDDRKLYSDIAPGNAVSAIDRLVKDEVNRLNGRIAA